jgi:hypothetical protein
MEKFLELWDRAIEIYPHLNLDIGYSKIADWVLTISIGRTPSRKHLVAFDSSSKDYLFAKAYCWLVEYLIEENGGY